MTTLPPTIAVQTVQAGRRRSRGAVVARIVIPLLVIAIMAIGAVLVPILYHYDPLHTDLLVRLKPPGTVVSNGSVAILGTDQVGSDLFAEMMDGTRISLLVGAATLLIAGVVGVLLGLLAGYFGGWFDTVLMRIADVQLAFPSILLAILIASVLGQGS
ncbi:hypothetical protein GCM10025881_09270 [Pseudolysinimonas kribbensis]|uniref:ABC transmembrane type-1 domain-containing protein n=1 Tax=Pseudolysinimonas kribbensis TaxID=433641 RepID=A0ABQ6K0X3_9MICO|nr:ABC transporter permease subunit [Pseudolysinimonas kribbensis]GMA94103.1 hypothetical protein GCM10025881_09270 [Pseudolysinimonas kribbensis]